MSQAPMHPQRRLEKIIRECDQMIVDIESWNENRTDAPLEDCEQERIVSRLAKEAHAAYGTPEESAAWERLHSYVRELQATESAS